MSVSLSQNCVGKLYASVIEDVIGGVREYFMDEGVDEQVLLELKHTWELKLKNSKAIEVPKPDPEPVPPHIKKSPVPAKGGATQVAAAITSNKTVAVQITLPGVNSNNEARQLTIDVPSSALQGNQLQSVLSGPVISATMALPHNLATTLLQQHVNAALQGHASGMIPLQTGAMVANGTTSGPSRPNNGEGGVPQVDGIRDSSDEDNDDDDDDNDDDDNDDDDKDDDEDIDPDEAEDAVEEEPLNSGDDVSEDDPGDMFETDNVVVCQYDKITRSRNKWKFYLKDGIMNLGGKDYVFQKSSGDAEW